jgi:hypothetical protein
MPPLPEWECRSPAKKKAMERWVNEQLDELPLPPALLAATTPKAVEEFRAYWSEPRLKRKQGRPIGKHPLTEFVVRDAQREIRAVRHIWKQHYGKSNRGYNTPRAAEIVYRRFLAMGFDINPKSLGMKARPRKL